MLSARSAFLFFLVTIFITQVNAQEASPGGGGTVGYLRDRLAAHAAARPSGNLYLHLDKTVYAPDETVWFKAYLLGDTSMESRVLYVRIVNRERTVVAQGQFPVYDIRSHGSLDLSSPDGSRVMGYRYIHDPPWEPFEGDYRLYAYTDRMVALNDTNVFVQPISIRRRGGRGLEAEASVSGPSRPDRGGGVRVKATVRYGGSPLEGARGEYRLLSGGEEVGYGRLRTDVLGNALLDFTYPETVPDSGSLRLELLFLHGEVDTELSLALPHSGSPLLVDCRGEGGAPVAGGRASVEVLDIHGHPVSTGVLVMDGDTVVDSLRTDVQGIAVWEVPDIPGARYTLVTVDGKGSLAVDVPAGGDYTLRLLDGPTGRRAVVHSHGSGGSALLVARSADEVVWSHGLEIAAGGSAAVDIPAGSLPPGVWSVSVFDGEGGLHAERLFGTAGPGDPRVSVDTDRGEYGRKGKVTVRLKATDAAGNPVVANLSVSATETARLDSGSSGGIPRAIRYGSFARTMRGRLASAFSMGSGDALLMGLRWPGNGWGDVLAGTTPAPPRIPGTNGATGLVVGLGRDPQMLGYPVPVKGKVNIREVRLRAAGVHFTDGGFGPAVERMTVGVDPETGTFFVPDSLLFSRKGQEWLLEVPRATNNPWAIRYQVEWQDPDIAFDSTVVRGRQLYRPAVLGSFAASVAPGVSATDFGGMNLLHEVVVGRKKRPVRRTLRKTDCQLYEEILHMMLYEVSSNKSYIWGSAKWPFRKGYAHSWGWYPYGGAKNIMYLGCGRYRDIGYIRNITVPAEFPLPDYGVSPTKVEDTRSTVYWDPNIVTGADGTATFSFYTSDTVGGYTITVQGINAYTLAPVSGEGGFKVITE